MAKTIRIKVTDIEVKRRGNIIVFIFGEIGYPKKHEDAILSKTAKVLQESLIFEFEVDDQEFAIKVLHDEDENGKVTKNWTGIIPAEGLGFSNGQKLGTFGPPKYENSKLKLMEVASELVIPIIYP